MTIKSSINIIVGIFLVYSIVSAFYGARNLSKNNRKSLNIVNILYLVYLLLINVVIFYFDITIGLEILLLWIFEVIAGIILLIQIIANLMPHVSNLKDTFNIKIIAIVLILIPVILIGYPLTRDILLIKNSKMVVAYESVGNGGFGDYDDFTYVITDNDCFEVDISVEYLNNFLSKNLKKTHDVLKTELDYENTPYSIKLDDRNDNITVKKDEKTICNKRLDDEYFNIEYRIGYINKELTTHEE